MNNMFLQRENIQYKTEFFIDNKFNELPFLSLTNSYFKRFSFKEISQMHKKKNNLNLKCTLSGSFNRYFSEISDFYDDLKYYNFKILSPQEFEISDDSTDFIRLKSDIGTTIGEIESHHLQAIENSQFILVINPKKYIGISTALEIGFAVANKKLILFSDGIPELFKSDLENRHLFSSFSHCIEDIHTFLADFYNYQNFKIESFIKNQQRKKTVFLDNSNKPISIFTAYVIGKMIAYKLNIVCSRRPNDILLKDILFWYNDKTPHYRRLNNLINLNHFESTRDFIYHKLQTPVAI